MNRRDLLRASFALPLTVFGLGLAACARTHPVQVGLHAWVGYEPLLLAEHFGWLGDKVRLHQGGSASDSIAGLEAGTLDAACLTLDEVLGVRARGLPLTVILVLNESVGADVVLARAGISALTDLEGKRLAVEKGGVGALVLQKLLMASGLTKDDIELIDVPPSEHAPLWHAGEIDAAISYPPYSKVLLRDGAVALFDSREFPQTIFDELAVRSDRMRHHRAALRTLVEGQLRALDHLRLSREDGLRRIGAWRGLEFEEVETSFRGLHLPGKAENYRLLAADGALPRAAQALSQLMAIDTSDTLSDLVSTDFLPRGL